MKLNKKMTIWGGGTFIYTVDRSSRSWSARVPKHDLKKSSTKFGRQKDLSFFSSASHHARILTVPCHSCCCSLLVPNTLMAASVPLSTSINFSTFTVLSLGSGSGHSAPSRPLFFFPNFNKMVWFELLNMGVQQLEDVFSVVHKNFRAWINTRVGTLIVANIYLQLTQNRYMFRSFTVLHCSHQHCLQPVASDVEVVGYL